MTRIVLDILDDEKAEALMVLLRDLSYIEVREDGDMKIWDGNGLRAIQNPVGIDDFKIFPREELHER
ncbi:MAG: hypothetical protein LBU13_11610 [Synergistaceae bacterium]|jgi:hypothetical protein|nr:hypothetical protein [Synergistaceae bacterium]